jgi:hypothetical protein
MPDSRWNQNAKRHESVNGMYSHEAYSFWNPQPRPSLACKLEAVSRELSKLLQEQERLLEVPMSAAQMTLYEMRSEQIRALMDQLPAEMPRGNTFRALRTSF